MQRVLVFLRLTSLTLLATVGLAACDTVPDVVLADSFPTGHADLTRFPKRVQGEFVASADTTRQLAVLPTAVVRRVWSVPRWIRVGEADSLRAAGVPVRLVSQQGDTVLLTVRYVDTVFALTEPARSRLRRAGGAYYLNQRVGIGQWTAHRLRLNGQTARLTQFVPDSVRTATLPDAPRPEAYAGQTRRVVRLSPAQQRAVIRDAGWWREQPFDTVYVRR